jgi:transcriptional antiterminator RfaH
VYWEQDRSLSAKTDLTNTGAALSDPEGPIVWYVAYTQPHHESLAVTNLQRQNFRAYLPLFKTLKRPTKTRPVMGLRPGVKTRADAEQAEAQVVYEPMFPRYIFFGPSDYKQSIAPARSTRGVNSIVMCGAELAVVQPEVVQAIQALEHERSRAELLAISPFQPGRRVRLSDPALSGLEGIIQSVSTKRIILLLEILGRQKAVTVKHSQVELV